MEYVNQTELSSTAAGALKGFLPLFYLVPPAQSTFKTVAEVPNYVNQVVPYFLVMILLEIGLRRWQGLPKMRLNDSIGSLTAGLLLQFSDVVVKGMELVPYVWVYENYRVYELPWDSPITWYLCFLVYDCAYYWFHRMAHEINIFWAAHQTHHSSEMYNLTTALRQSIFQKFNSFMFNLPLALCIPPSVYLVHKQFNLLYQFWIHTEVINTLGPLEYILNTPSHHRVHHGRNRYCIDKNYAGVLIIWDRMFGTFQPEIQGHKIYYGLVHNIKSFNPIWIQIQHYVCNIKRTWNTEGLGKKLNVLLKGPGWVEGAPRLGNIENVPEVPEDTSKYSPIVPLWIHWYCAMHFTIVVATNQFLGAIIDDIPYLTSVGIILYMVFCLTNFGLMFDKKPLCAVLEITRLIFLLVIDPTIRLHVPSVPLQVFQGLWVVHAGSLMIWCCVLVRQFKELYNDKGKVD